jgi:cyclopropane fatty-acyl-phospholipid synthase-like methyltransferase
MVAEARPGVHVVGLDNFSAQYIRGNSRDLFLRNAKAAGIGDRVDVMEADMRQIPAPAGSFDGAVSTYAIDHLGRQGIHQSLSEVSRVLKPGGDFLLMVIQRDPWLFYVYGPAVIHSFAPPAFWDQQLQQAGFQVVEEGKTPGSAHFLCRKL